LAYHRDAKKRLKQSEKRRVRNMAVRSFFRGRIRACRTAIQARDEALARERFREAERAIRRAMSKGVIHSNTADRYISRLAQQVNSLSSQAKSGPA
jgi:small subunit ribosomal protein S20